MDLAPTIAITPPIRDKTIRIIRDKFIITKNGRSLILALNSTPIATLTTSPTSPNGPMTESTTRPHAVPLPFAEIVRTPRIIIPTEIQVS